MKWTSAWGNYGNWWLTKYLCCDLQIWGDNFPNRLPVCKLWRVLLHTHTHSHSHTHLRWGGCASKGIIILGLIPRRPASVDMLSSDSWPKRYGGNQPIRKSRYSTVVFVTDPSVDLRIFSKTFNLGALVAFPNITLFHSFVMNFTVPADSCSSGSVSWQHCHHDK